MRKNRIRHSRIAVPRIAVPRIRAEILPEIRRRTVSTGTICATRRETAAGTARTKKKTNKGSKRAAQ